MNTKQEKITVTTRKQAFSPYLHIILSVFFLMLSFSGKTQLYNYEKIEDTVKKHIENNDFESATKVYHRYLKLENQLTQSEKVDLFYEYSSYLKFLGDYDGSLMYLDKMKKALSPEFDRYNWFNQRSYRQKTYIYFDTHEMDSSRKFLDLLLNDHSEISERDMVFITNVQAYFSFLDGNYSKAERVYLENVEFILNDREIRCGLPLVTVKLMQLYGKMDKSEELKKIFKETIEVCKECEDVDSEVYARYVMAELSEDIDDFETAHSEYKIARTMEDSLKELKHQEVLAELDKKYQTEIKDETIKSQKESEKLSQLIMIILGLLVLMIALFLWRVWLQRKRLNNQNIIIQENLEEKQLLLKEIHHRVKNNFQIVSSLLELQTKGIEDEKALELALEGQNRVKSMAIIHQKLYQNDNLLIEFDDYVTQLVREIQNMNASKKMTTEINIESGITLDIDTAIPLGLVLNELITNSFKYGFDSNKEENTLLIKIEKGIDNYSMIVADSGSGIPENINLNTVKSIGLRLVRRLSKQLGGAMTYTYKNGAEFEIVFKDTIMRAV